MTKVKENVYGYMQLNQGEQSSSTVRATQGGWVYNTMWIVEFDKV